MEITRERISLTFDQKDMLLSVLLSVQIGFRFVRVASACAIFERTSGFEPFFLNNCFEVFEACYSIQLFLISLDLPSTLVPDRLQWSIKSCSADILFSSKFTACSCGIRSPGAFSLAKLL